jgi:hypothetical protein
MTLNTRLHTLEATLFFMTLKALKLVEARRWRYVVWKFIEKRSSAVEMKDQLHAIWYLILFPYMAG